MRDTEALQRADAAFFRPLLERDMPALDGSALFRLGSLPLCYQPERSAARVDVGCPRRKSGALGP